MRNPNSDNGLSVSSSSMQATSSQAPDDVLLADALSLSSRPSASRKIYLNFLGGTVSGTAWNSQVGTFTNPAYDRDGDPTTFSDAERRDIVAIWRAVAEDYSPFDVDVTTIRPLSFAGNLHVMVGGAGSWYSSQLVGGVAYLGSYANERLQPVFVFPNNLGPNYAKYVWEAVSHEIGHALVSTQNIRAVQVYDG
jgi:hypothetical protein